MSKKLLIFGGSGHAKDVCHVAKLIGYDMFAFVTTNGTCAVDDFPAKKESDIVEENYLDWDCIVAIGNNDHRRRFQEQYTHLRFTNIVSPLANVCNGATLGAGCFVGAFAYIGPDTTIGDGVIVNTQTVVGHDVTIGSFSHICPRVCLAGHVALGESTFIGAGALFNNGQPDQELTVPEGTHVGMGCIVTESIKQPNSRLIPKPNYISIENEQ